MQVDLELEFVAWAPGIFKVIAVDRARGLEGHSGGVPGVTPTQAIANALYHLDRAYRERDLQ